MNLYSANVQCLFFAVVVFCVVLCLEHCTKRNKLQAQLFPPATGPWLPPLQHLLQLQVTLTACGTCFVSSARWRYCGCLAVSCGSEKVESCFLRLNAAGTSCHFHTATFIPVYLNNAPFRELENVRLAHFLDVMEWAAQREMPAGKGCTSHQFRIGYAGVSVSEHLVVLWRWDLMWVRRYWWLKINQVNHWNRNSDFS